MPRPYRYLRLWLLPLVRSRIWTIRGTENIPTSGGFIIAPNHQAWVDSPILAGAIYRRLEKPLRYVAMSGKYSSLGGLPIDLNNRRAVIDVAFDFLQRGYPIAIFPEGNSNTNLELRTGKTGAARLALRSGLPVVPVGIKGTKGVKPWQGFLWFISFWRPCHVQFGPPIRFPKRGLTEHDDAVLQATTAEIMRRISLVSGKPMPGEGVEFGRHTWVWYLFWRMLRPLVQWRIRLKGKEFLPESGPFMVAANHSSYFDAPALSMAIFHVTGLQAMYPTKQAVAETFQRLSRGMFNAFGMIPLNNLDRARVLEPAIHHLKRGGVIGIFPEGTRNKPSLNPRWKTELLKGKTGAVRLMLATGAPIIPATIRAPRGLTIVETIMNTLKIWKFVRVEFGAPVAFPTRPAGEPTKDDLDQMTRVLMQRIATLSKMQYPY